MQDRNLYANPLVLRYSSEEMSKNFSDQKKYSLWRKLWIVLAESEKELGLNIKDEQISQMKEFENDIDFDLANRFEKELRHDVMAHIKTFGTQAPLAMPIIHLGATSCYCTDNAEIIIIKDALNIIKKKLVSVMELLKDFALKYKDLPTLSFTHFQPAQLSTVGKRATLWLQDLYLDLENLDFILENVRLRGVKGTTGTQASFLDLFDGDNEKVKRLDDLVVTKLGFNKKYAVTGQTYPRKFDYTVLSILSQIAQSCYKFANDLRLLQSLKEIEEPFETNQVGSSAMAYKRNPMRSERMCSLSRFVMTMPMNASFTASTQWFERTLDDSANKRIVISQSFLALDGVLNLYLNVVNGLVVYDKVIDKHVSEELPFMATENIIMEGVKAGGDRQELHEEIRKMSMIASENVKIKGEKNNLIELISKNEKFANIKDRLDGILDKRNFIGRSVKQTEEFIKDFIDPILDKNKIYLGVKGKVEV